MQTDFSSLALSLGLLRKSKPFSLHPQSATKSHLPAPHNYHFLSSFKASLSSSITNQWFSPKQYSLMRTFQSDVLSLNYTLTDISSQNIFYLFLLESSFDYKLVITIYRTTMKENKNISLLFIPVRN